jgi:hypothetical protein
MTWRNRHHHPTSGDYLAEPSSSDDLREWNGGIVVIIRPQGITWRKHREGFDRVLPDKIYQKPLPGFIGKGSYQVSAGSADCRDLRGKPGRGRRARAKGLGPQANSALE